MKNCLVVLHIHDTFCVEFNFCREKFVGESEGRCGGVKKKNRKTVFSFDCVKTALKSDLRLVTQAESSNGEENQNFMIRLCCVNPGTRKMRVLQQNKTKKRLNLCNTYPCGSWAELSQQLLPLYPTFSSTFHSHPV